MTSVDLKSQGLTMQLGAVVSNSLERQVNGRDAVDAPFAPSTANTNFAPLAPENTGLLASTRVQTPQGPVAIEDLAPGAQVIDENGNTAIVQHILQAPTPKTAMRMRAPYFGLDQDVILGSEHRLCFSGEITEYLFGELSALVPVWALKDGVKIQHVELTRKDRLFQLQLDTGLPVRVGKCALASGPSYSRTGARALDTNEARCFAAEYRTGFDN